MDATTGERVALSRLVWAGPLAAVLAMVAVTIVRQIAVSVLNPDPRFLPLNPVGPPVLALVGAVWAVAVLAIIGGIAQRPVWLYMRLSLVVLLVSLVFPVTLLVPGVTQLFPGGGIPGTTPGAVGFLVVMHVVAWAAIVLPLTWLVGEPRAGVPPVGAARTTTS